MKQIFEKLSNRVTGIALAGLIVAGGSAVAFSQKPKADFTPPAVDERPCRGM